MAAAVWANPWRPGGDSDKGEAERTGAGTRWEVAEHGEEDASSGDAEVTQPPAEATLVGTRSRAGAVMTSGRPSRAMNGGGDADTQQSSDVAPAIAALP